MTNQTQIVQATHRKEALLSLAYLSHILVTSPVASYVNELSSTLPEHATYFKTKCDPKSDKHFASHIAGLCILNDSLEVLNNYCSFDLIRSHSERETSIVTADFCNNGNSPLGIFEELNFDAELKKLLYFIEFEQEKSSVSHEVVQHSLLDCNFPSLSVSLGFFRPQKNELELLQALIDKDIMAPAGKLVVVVNKATAETIAPLLTSHFKIFEVSKALDDTHCFMICEKLAAPTTNTSGMNTISSALKKNKTIAMKSFKRMFTFVDIAARKDELESISNRSQFISDPNDVSWDAFKSLVSLGSKKQDKIVIPKAPKQGELSLFIASGTINGELALPTGDGKHIVLGGVELLRDTEEKTSYSKTGGAFESTVVTKSSKPFLNLLVNNKGKMMIKKLQDN